ncbi:unnamed protein product [Rotaria magnacalcarata]|uniref:Uncharacterized protein n=1 Tax=Rotaria magnacalcarata TaxID=392030 RepID=A0A8S3AJH8_9BILA|nr:unnamed protein product [Rotaria magnacalcarata]
MNNTASISIMLPVALAVVHELGIYSENSLNRQQAAVINGITFDSTNGEGSDENKIEELTRTTQNCQTSKSETFVEINTHFKLLCCKRQKPEVDDRSKKKTWPVEERHINDGTVAIFCGILPLILPDSNPFNRKILFSIFILKETNVDKRCLHH